MDIWALIGQLFKRLFGDNFGPKHYIGTAFGILIIFLMLNRSDSKDDKEVKDRKVVILEKKIDSLVNVIMIRDQYWINKVDTITATNARAGAKREEALQQKIDQLTGAVSTKERKFIREKKRINNLVKQLEEPLKENGIITTP